MNLLLKLVLFALFSIALAHNKLDSHILPRPLILEYHENREIRLIKEVDEEDILRCRSWRFAVEANNLGPWTKIPSECAGYVNDYVTGRAYSVDLEMVAKEAGNYARSFKLGDDGKDVWVFDVDETLLSNLPYYVDHGYGLETFDGQEFDKWVEKAMAPAIESSLKLYEEILGLGFKVFLLTGRSERHRSVTVKNLRKAGFQNWDKLILRELEDHEKTATTYKSKKRNEMVEQGFRIIGNSGDQWSDLQGSSMSNRSFKIPNPMYYIP